MSANATQWTPPTAPTGRHQVSMGKSMARFLKQRKGQQANQSKPLPTSSFYHFKYKFMPESVDTNKPGVLELTSKDITTARVERASQQSEEVHIFRGQEEAAKEVECVLIYDPESGTFTLEKLDSSLILQHEGRGPPKNRPPSASPLPNEPSPVTSTQAGLSEDQIFRELESTLAGELNDSDDEDIPLSASSKIVADKRKQAVSQVPAPPRSGGSASSVKATPTAAKTKPKLKAAGDPTTSTVSAKPVKATQKKKAAAPKPPSPAVPAAAAAPRPALKAKAKPTAPSTTNLALPPTSSKPKALALPTSAGSGSGGGLALPSSAGNEFVSLPTGMGTSTPTIDDDDDEDEWDQVAGAGEAASPGPSGGSGAGADEDMFGDHKFADEMEEIDLNVDDFAAQMDQELLGGLEEEGDGAEGDGEDEGEGDEDEDMFDDMEEVTPAPSTKPISLNQFAGGAAEGDDDEEDYSSTSESDDD